MNNTTELMFDSIRNKLHLTRDDEKSEPEYTETLNKYNYCLLEINKYNTYITESLLNNIKGHLDIEIDDIINSNESMYFNYDHIVDFRNPNINKFNSLITHSIINKTLIGNEFLCKIEFSYYINDNSCNFLDNHMLSILLFLFSDSNSIDKTFSLKPILKVRKNKYKYFLTIFYFLDKHISYDEDIIEFCESDGTGADMDNTHSIQHYGFTKIDYQKRPISFYTISDIQDPKLLKFLLS